MIASFFRHGRPYWRGYSLECAYDYGRPTSVERPAYLFSTGRQYQYPPMCVFFCWWGNATRAALVLGFWGNS
jgi:hypothetical protein